MAISQKSGDTVNILSPFNHGLKPKDKDITFTFNGKEGKIGRLFMSGELSVHDKKVDLEAYRYVYRDVAYDDVALNNHPSIIGMIGTKKKEDLLP